MRLQLVAAVGFAALLAGPVSAADMGVLHKAPAMMEDTSWSGLYFDVSGGGGWGHSSWDVASVFNGGPIGGTGSFDQSGWLAGAGAGYNWRVGQVVFGLDVDFSAADIQGTTGAGPCTGGCQTKLAWFHTGRARLGLPFGAFMPYVTGGAAAIGLKDRAGSSNESAVDPRLWGWVVGGGLEFMVLPQWTLRAEYLHADFPGSLIANDIGFFGTTSITERNVNIFRVGVSYYLGRDQGIVSSVSSKY